MATALDWLQQQSAPGSIQWGEDTITTSGDENRRQSLYGALAGTGMDDEFRATLKQFSDSAGLPGFDWTPYEAQAAYDHFNQFNKVYTFDTPWGAVLQNIVNMAGASNPQIGQVWQQAVIL